MATEVATAMRRRDVLIGGLAWAQLLASRRARAQGPSTRAAVVIGVNRTGNLPILQAAAAGAKSVAQWLAGEDFDVTSIVDDAQPVTAAAIKQAVTGLVNKGTLTQLVVYFSGHGMSFGYNEYWLLTGAPDDPNEAVSVMECWELAHKSGIPNVIFISDACRSIPDYNASLVRGTLIFPNRPLLAGSRRSEVDRFLATEPGAPSFEVALAASRYTGIYTSTFLDAFMHPQPDMVRTIEGKSVIPNIMLQEFLSREVPLRLGNVDLQHTQYPDSRIESRDQNYIGRALGPAIAALAPDVPKKVTTLDIANHQLDAAGVRAPNSFRRFSPQIIAQAASDSGFKAGQKSILEASRPDSFDARTGFAISGARVRFALAAADSNAEIVTAGGGAGEPALVRIAQPRDRPVSVGLMFEDGSGTVVAALPGFVGTLTVEGGRVTSVTYLPSRNSNRWDEYASERKRLDELRALVATAAKFGVFRIEGAKDDKVDAARRLADQIRVLKGIDPTLGIYAAYAYADANLTEQVRSVYAFMRGDLGIDLFDIALVADALSGKRIEGPGDVVPFCPMLTQGWQLLRVKEVSLSEQVERARNDMRQALWTTFGPRGMDSIFSAIQAARNRNAG
ncbi:caspase family protein [Bradyrhizobium sp.]|uniref:caspase family protein n=1 Tax=Bradyrhizobium sp. TaxID=376 RepID=UPI003C78F3A2